MQRAENIRNIAIIAHIDHGKTTLIDSIFRAAQVFRENARVEERIMDNDDLEREKGITIRSKHCTVEWKGYRINIVDTPGHADFSGEVERILSTVDSVLLLVDAGEGPMPQTRYVLSRALAMGINPIVFINKVDRKEADVITALNATFDLFFELGATEEQADFPVLYGSGLSGWAVREQKDIPQGPSRGMTDLFETVVQYVPPPMADVHAPFLMQVTTITWNEYTGRIGCGKILQGTIRKGEEFLRTATRWDGEPGDCESFSIVETERTKAVQISMIQGLQHIEAEEATAGNIVWISGPKEIGIGDTFSSLELEGQPLPPLDIEEPTVSMFFLVNNGPFAGQEGQASTLRQLKARLQREMHANVALRMEDLGRHDSVKVSGRGELQLAILIEEMRREGMEFCVSKPEVITVTKNGQIHEPMEELVVDVPDEFQGTVFDKVTRRKGRVKEIQNLRTGLIRILFSIPTRGLIGYRGEFLTDTRGLGIMTSRFTGHAPWCGEITPRNRGSLVSLDTGAATSYQLENLQDRGVLFVSPMEMVYAGMIVGENSRGKDMPCNPTKRKQSTNIRSSTKDFTTKLDVPRKMSLEQALEWIAEDELVEITPKSIRLRKSILDEIERRKASRRGA